MEMSAKPLVSGDARHEALHFRVASFMDDPRIVEVLTEMLEEQKETRQELKQVNTRLERLEKQQQTTNLKLQELTLSNVRLADELKTVGQYAERIMRLESAVFH
jgi:septal ring factor EnvC (AmiA/AmiB activator)